MPQVESILSDALDVEFKVYTYITADNEPGTIIVHPDLTKPFDDQILLEMDKLCESKITLRQLLQNGFTKFGDADNMDLMSITYPLDQSNPDKINKIVGRHMYINSNNLVELFGKDFVCEEGDADSVHSSDLSEDSFKEEPIRYVNDEFVEFDISDSFHSSHSSESGDAQNDVVVKINTVNTDQNDMTPSDQLDGILEQLDHIQSTVGKEVEKLLAM